MQYRLRTLLIVLALGLLAATWWGVRDWQGRRAIEPVVIQFRRATTVEDQLRNLEEARAEANARSGKSPR